MSLIGSNMTSDQYKGKRNNITFPKDIHEKIQALADSEGRTYSQMVVRLCVEALQQRETKET